MDFNDVFRSFFGSFSPRGSRFMDDDDEFDGADFFSTPSDFHGHQDDDDGDDDMTFGGGHGGSFPPHGGDFFFRFEEDTRNIFGHFEEMFKNFGHNEFLPSVFSEAGKEPPTPSLPSPSSKHRSPRDLMLKHPDSDEPSTAPSTTLPDQAGKDRLQGNPSAESPSWFSLWTSKPEWQWTLPSLPSSTHREDQDIDEQVKGRKLDEILTQRDPSSSSSSSSSSPSAIFSQTPTFRSYSKSISIQTVRKPDGTVEQRRTETDGDGNVTTTVTSTNPNEGRNSHTSPGWRTPPCQRSPTTDPFRNRVEDTPLAQDKTDSIFKKLFGSWS
ncbi:HCLS1-associated protein X-1-like [Asterias rubens]|uniref:HCLS1-associated protein X-1-like n=1 Tax=Asterias rubens TaxID=7604 RepID=UPI0014551891|nr:HCLS1-associated protein X-1-like [Asterias rubens]